MSKATTTQAEKPLEPSFLLGSLPWRRLSQMLASLSPKDVTYTGSRLVERCPIYVQRLCRNEESQRLVIRVMLAAESAMGWPSAEDAVVRGYTELMRQSTYD